MIHKLIYRVGQKIRNPSIRKWYHFLKESEKWPREKLETYQLQKLRYLIDFADTHSPYYQNLFKEKGLSSADIKSLKDIKKFPTISKEELIKYNRDIHTNYPFKKKFVATTSGSSGNTLSFNRDESADSFNRASIFRGYSWHLVHPWERNGYFWGYNFSFTERLKVKLLDTLQNRFRIFTYKEQELVKFARKLQYASYLHGYSSMIYETAKCINVMDLPKPKKLKMVKGTSEKIFPYYQQEIQKAFGQRIISEYGATESGIIAFECPSGNMHINMEGVLVEEVDNEILVTNLEMHSFPVIRYKLGDYIKLGTGLKTCACGRDHTILEEVTGRVGNKIIGKDQEYPSLYFYYIFKNLSLNKNLELSYQVIQREKGKLEFYILEEMNANEKQLLISEIRHHFGNDILFTIYQGKPKEQYTGKTKSFISYL
ncbi:phenylacetate--CoA ligase family protein [Ascidiimonas aurantiaca]|uniref:phenylacetate--CoA ligase family protein n=1 Tax=Ascidiimonas aurantiaca TaxID=1685432 RepID=UPI0030EE024F